MPAFYSSNHGTALNWAPQNNFVLKSSLHYRKASHHYTRLISAAGRPSHCSANNAPMSHAPTTQGGAPGGWGGPVVLSRMIQRWERSLEKNQPILPGPSGSTEEEALIKAAQNVIRSSQSTLSGSLGQVLGMQCWYWAAYTATNPTWKSSIAKMCEFTCKSISLCKLSCAKVRTVLNISNERFSDLCFSLFFLCLNTLMSSIIRHQSQLSNIKSTLKEKYIGNKLFQGLWCWNLLFSAGCFSFAAATHLQQRWRPVLESCTEACCLFESSIHPSIFSTRSIPGWGWGDWIYPSMHLQTSRVHPCSEAKYHIIMI